jgi:serine/threonine protein kinase
MLSEIPPFIQAEATDQYYKLIAKKKFKEFWKVHNRGRKPGFFSRNFRDLTEKMLAQDPKDRLTMKEILNHPWMKGKMPTHEEIAKVFAERKKIMEAKSLAQKKH